MPLTETMRGGKHFACISGHDAKTNPDAFRDLADVDTVVVFMGGRNIASVVDALLMNPTFGSEQAAATTKSRSSKATAASKRTKSTPCAVVRDVDGAKRKTMVRYARRYRRENRRRKVKSVCFHRRRDLQIRHLARA